MLKEEYTNLKILGPNGIITVDGTFSHASMCGHEHYELATAIINSTKLLELRNSMTPAVPDCKGLTSSSAFHLTKETKVVEIDPTDSTKMVWIGTKLPAK